MNLKETKLQLILAYETVLQSTSTIQTRKDAENVNITTTSIISFYALF